MSFLVNIYWYLYDVSTFFYDAYLTASEWISPFNNLATPMYAIYSYIGVIMHEVDTFNVWLGDLVDTISGFLTLDQIVAALGSYLQYAADAWAWVSNATGNVAAIVDSWWTGTWTQIVDLVNSARTYAEDLVAGSMATIDQLAGQLQDFFTVTLPGLVADIGDVQALVQDFFTSTLPGLATWAGVQDLIESTVRSWFPFYDELAELWTGIRDFFTDPEAAIYRLLETTLERFW